MKCNGKNRIDLASHIPGCLWENKIMAINIFRKCECVFGNRFRYSEHAKFLLLQFNADFYVACTTPEILFYMKGKNLTYRIKIIKPAKKTRKNIDNKRGVKFDLSPWRIYNSEVKEESWIMLVLHAVLCSNYSPRYYYLIQVGSY